MAVFVALRVEEDHARNAPGTLWIHRSWMSMRLPMSSRARWLIAAMILSGLTWTGLITAVSMMMDENADQLSTANTR